MSYIYIMFMQPPKKLNGFFSLTNSEKMYYFIFFPFEDDDNLNKNN